MKSLCDFVVMLFFSTPQMSVRASDGGDPARVSAPVRATLNILRNDFTPSLTFATPQNIREDIGTNPVVTITSQDFDTTVSYFT